MPDRQALLSQLEPLRQRFAQQLPQRLEHIGTLCQALEREWNEAQLRDLRIAAHSLAGSAGTFGFPGVGELAKTLEAEVVQWLEGGIAPEDIRWQSVHELVARAQARAGRPDPSGPAGTPGIG